MSKNQTNYDEIQDKHLDTMIKLTFEYEDALEAQDNDEEVENMPAIALARKETVWNKVMEKYTKVEAEEKKKTELYNSAVLYHALFRWQHVWCW